jgi:hypothetical protein
MKQLNITADKILSAGPIEAPSFIEDGKSIAEIYETPSGAQGKADTALNMAKSYADNAAATKANAAQAAAIAAAATDAATKANAAQAAAIAAAATDAATKAAAALNEAKQDAADKYVLQEDTSYVQYQFDSSSRRTITADTVETSMLRTTDSDGEQLEVDIATLASMVNYDLAQGEF